MARWTSPHEQSCYKLFYSTRKQLALLKSLLCSEVRRGDVLLQLPHALHGSGCEGEARDELGIIGDHGQYQGLLNEANAFRFWLRHLEVVVLLVKQVRGPNCEFGWSTSGLSRHFQSHLLCRIGRGRGYCPFTACAISTKRSIILTLPMYLSSAVCPMTLSA